MERRGCVKKEGDEDKDNKVDEKEDRRESAV